MTRTGFQKFIDRAAERKGGEQRLEDLLNPPLSSAALAEVRDDRVLSAMARGVFQAGFTWSVIAQKWPGFEAAFLGFDVSAVLNMQEDARDALHTDTRIVRNGQKIKTVFENARFIEETSKEHGSFGQFLASWPPSRQTALFDHLKKHGARLGGNTARWVLRYVGYDSFVLSSDVVASLQEAGLEIKAEPSGKGELARIQAQFSDWHEETGLSYSILSQIAAYSRGINRHAVEEETLSEAVKEALKKGEIPQI